METTNRIVAGHPDASAQMHSNVLAYRQPAAQIKREGAAKPGGTSGDEGVQTPSTYMLMISRVENMAQRGAFDERTLEQLRAHLTSHLGAASEAGRQSISNLREFGALGEENVADLPQAIVRSIRDPLRAQKAFALLKQPAFSAFMRDDVRAQVYGPRGVLRAS